MANSFVRDGPGRWQRTVWSAATGSSADQRQAAGTTLDRTMVAFVPAKAGSLTFFAL